MSGATRTRTGPRLQSAPVNGSVESIQRCHGRARPMERVAEGQLANGGLAGDAHFEPQSIRQLLIADAETLDALDLNPGDIRENLTLRDISVMGLSAGSTLEVGQAEVEITKECTPCRVMEGVRPGLMRELSGRRGMYARVLRPGTVRRGDAVRVLDSIHSEL